MTISSAAFFAGVSGLIRLGRAVREEYRAHLRAQPFEALLPPGCPPARDSAQMRAAAATFIRANYPGLLAENQQFHRLFRDPNSARTDLNPDAGDLVEAAINFYLTTIAGVAGEAASRTFDLGGKPLLINRSVVLTHKEWVADRGPRWGRLGLQIADIALDVISVQPEVLGLNRRTTEIVAALAANMNALVSNDVVAGDADDSPGERLVRHFVQASVETVAERPELFVTAERWKPIVSGVVVPLKEHIERNPGLEFLTRERLGEMLRGPLAHSVLSAIDANADAFLTSSFGSDQVLGAVARSVLGAITSADQQGFDLKQVFSDEGAAMVFEAALGVARDQPDLFVKGIGAGADAQRQFLRGVASSLIQAPRPYKWTSGLAPQIAALSFEVAGSYASRKLRSGESADPWAAAGADVAEHLLKQIMDGFVAITGDTAARNPFERIFTPEQAVDVLRIIATRAADTPEMLIGANANAEVRNIAMGVARVLTEDTTGLLDGEDWRTVITTAVDIAARNPGALFGIAGEGGVENQVAVALMKSVMTQATDNMKNGRQPGAILFGETLREALTATLAAASSNLLSASAPSRALVSNIDAAGGDQIAALDAFIQHLLRLAVGDDPNLRMSADEWVHVYKTLVPHLLAYGRKAFPAEGTPDDGSGLAITNQLILDVLQAMITRTNQEGEVG